METFTIDEIVDRYQIYHLPSSENPRRVDIFKDLLHKGRDNFLPVWTSCTQETIPSTELYYAIAKALFYHQDKKEIEGLNNLLLEDFQYSRATSTMLYTINPTKIAHYFGTPQEKIVLVDLKKQKTGFLNSFHMPLCKALFGSENTKEIEEVFYWLTDQHTHIELPKNSPMNYFNVVFQTNVDRFSILANKNWTLQARIAKMYA